MLLNKLKTENRKFLVLNLYDSNGIKHSIPILPLFEKNLPLFLVKEQFFTHGMKGSFSLFNVLKGTKKLECTLPDGTGRRVIQNNLNYPFSIVSYADHFYHTDWRRWAWQHTGQAWKRQLFRRTDPLVVPYVTKWL